MTKDRVHERLQQKGYRASTVIELLTCALARDEDDLDRVEACALSLAKRHYELPEMSSSELAQAANMSPFEAARFLAAFELGRRSTQTGRGESDDLGSPEAIAKEFSHLKNLKQEEVWAAFLDTKLKLIEKLMIHRGTLNSSLVGGREVFRPAIKAGASSLVIVHNHPSGDPAPSPEDIEITKKLKDIGAMLDIPVLDHIIIGHPDFTSFARMQLL